MQLLPRTFYELAEEPLDSRIVWHLAQECGMSDGGIDSTPTAVETA